MDKSKVLLTAHSFWPERTGVAEVVASIATGLQRRGMEIHVATAAANRHESHELMQGLRVHRFPVWGNIVSGITGAQEAYKSFVHGTEWDAVIMHCAQIWTSDLILLDEPPLKARRTIFVSHGMSQYSNPAYEGYFERLALALKRCDAMVALSSVLEEERFCSRYGLSRPHLIPNGVHLREWSNSPLGLRERLGIGNRPWIVNVSNHYPAKNHGAFFRVLHQLRKSVPEVKGSIIGKPHTRHFKGIPVGRGGCWYSCRLQSSLNPAVSLLSGLSRGELASAVQEADVFALTSRWEASPLVILESMAAGTPWVSLRVGNVGETPGGVVVDTEEEMSEALRELLAAGSRTRKEMGAAGRIAAERLDWECIVSNYQRMIA
jgi:glycosyltransferase involved in cell wall biosynthesis